VIRGKAAWWYDDGHFSSANPVVKDAATRAICSPIGNCAG
jgi:hypothetical protein